MQVLNNYNIKKQVFVIDYEEFDNFIKSLPTPITEMLQWVEDYGNAIEDYGVMLVPMRDLKFRGDKNGVLQELHLL